jgi:hypothetical protein
MIIYFRWCWVSWYSDIDEVYQEEELIASFVVDPGAGLDDLVGDADDIQISMKQNRKQIKKNIWFSRLRTRVPERDADEFWN